MFTYQSSKAVVLGTSQRQVSSTQKRENREAHIEDKEKKSGFAELWI